MASDVKRSPWQKSSTREVFAKGLLLMAGGGLPVYDQGSRQGRKITAKVVMICARNSAITVLHIYTKLEVSEVLKQRAST
jgi:hypothetical protein